MEVSPGGPRGSQSRVAGGMSKGESGGGDRGHGRTIWVFTPCNMGAMDAGGQRRNMS